MTGPPTTERVLLLTGHLAAPRLRRTMEGLGELPFAWEVRDIGVKVAALMTPAIIRRRIGPLEGIARVLLPGRCKGDLGALAGELGVPVERGPDELADLPQHFGKGAKRADLSRHDCLIFAEIVDASALTLDAILARARSLRLEGADVIDLGCLPDTPFRHLEDAVAALKEEGFAVSIDSGNEDDLARGARAGANYLLSLSEPTLDLAFETDAVPVLIPSPHGDLPSLLRAAERMERAGRPYFADPILDPIHFGFTDSIVRYHAFRRAMPDAPILMGIGNLTELTDADTTGITATLMGMVSELRVGAVLVVQVSPHCRKAVAESDLARRMMHAARGDGALPQGYAAGLMSLRDRRPVTATPADVAANAAAVTDANYRIEVSDDGVHVYNRDGHHTAADPFDLYPRLGVEADGGHAFYLGVELARAQIAFQLGKRYTQDAELGWGVAVERPAESDTHLKELGSTRERQRKPSEP